MRVFVYGTLLRGHPNHRVMVMAGGQFLGETEVAGHVMVSLGGCPGVVPAVGVAGDRVKGELYEVATEEGVTRLDRLEGHPSFYRRTPVLLTNGTVAEVYLLQGSVRGCPRVPNGDWAAYVRERDEQARARVAEFELLDAKARADGFEPLAAEGDIEHTEETDGKE